MHEKFMRAHWEIEVFMLHHWAVEMKCAWIEWDEGENKINLLKHEKIQISFSRKQQKKASAMNACLPLIARLLSSPIFFCAVCYSPLLCVYSHRLSTATDCFISRFSILFSFEAHALFLLSFISFLPFGRYSWFMNLKLKREQN